MGGSVLGDAAKLLAPIARAAWPKARRLYQERRAAQTPFPRRTSAIDETFNETLDRLRGGVADEAWWHRIWTGLGHAVVAPDFFRVDAVREWLASEQVRSDLRDLARARLLGEQADDAATHDRLRATYMDATGEAERFANDRIDIALGVLAAGFAGTVDRAQEPVIGIVQAAASETRTQLSDIKGAVAALGADHFVVEEHTRRAATDLSLIRKRRSVDAQRAQRDVRALVERIDGGDLQHAELRVRDEALYWAARLHAGSPDTVCEAKAYRDRLRQSGSNVDTRVIDALISEAEGDSNAAVRILRDSGDSETRAALFAILRRVRAQDALAWFDDEPGTDDPSFFTGAGWANLAVCLAEAGRWKEAAERLEAVHDLHVDEWPDLAFVKGVINAALLLPDDLRRFALTMDLFHPAVRTVEGPEADQRRARADACFACAADLMSAIDLEARAQAARDWRLWLQLTSPEPAAAHSAREEVASGMTDGARAVALVPFARGFGIEFDVEPLQRHLARRRRLAGLEGRELLAELMLAETTMSPRERASFLEREEDRLADALPRGTLVGMRIEALVLDRRTEEARQLLGERTDELTDHDDERLALMIKAHTGADPRAELEDLLRRTGSLIDLQNLVGHLRRNGEWAALRPYAQELFRRERTAENLRCLIGCMKRDIVADEAAVLDLLEANADLVDGDAELTAERAWALFDFGSLEEARRVNDGLLVARDDERDLALDLNIALKAGDWERFPEIINREWPKRQAHQPPTLLRLGSIAAEADAATDRAVELARLAAERAPDDPQVLVGAYNLAIQVGREAEADPNWIARASEISSDRGPARAISFRMMIEEIMPAHREQAQKAERLWTRGEGPIHFASTMLNAPLSTLLLDLPRRNSEQRDGRRKAVIPVFSGARRPVDIQTDWMVGFDVTSLMVLSHLGLLRIAIATLSRIGLAPSTMLLLLNERRRTRFHQPSRVRDAEELRGLIDRRRLREAAPLPAPPAWLSSEVGRELAELLETARTAGGRVVHPFPIHKLRSHMEREAGLGEYRSLIISTVVFARILRESGYVDSDTHDRGDRYLRTHDRADDASVGPDPALLEQPVYLDGLALIYLQTTGILRQACAAGLDLRVHPALRDDQAALIEANREGEANAEGINELRSVLREALACGSAILLPGRDDGDYDGRSDAFSMTASTLFEFTRGAGPCDAVCLDDRWINEKANLTTRVGQTVPVVCSLDVLRFLRARDAISEEERLAALHRLRRAGFALIPIEAEELEARLRAAPIVSEGMLVESAELRSMRQNLLRVRSLDLVRLPEEEAYLVNLSLSAVGGVRRLWHDQAVPVSRALACTDWVWRSLALSPLDWLRPIGGRHDLLPPREAFARYLWLWLAPMAPEVLERQAAYRRWIDQAILEPMVSSNSDMIAAVAGHVKSEVERLCAECDAGENASLS